jgi:TonB family protein
MRPRINLICTALIVTAAAALFLSSGRIWSQSDEEQAPRFRRAKTNDKGLRQRATHAPIPAYPAESLARGAAGVAVAKVTMDPDGQTRTVDVLEAPDDAISRSVRAAVMQWKYKGVGVPATGDLVFYFHIRDGVGLVSSAEQMKALKTQSVGTNIEKAVEKTNRENTAREIDESEFHRLQAALNPVVLDVRERAAFARMHRAGATNIPLSELFTRSAAELSRSRAIVIDCFSAEYLSTKCGMAAQFLTSSSFSEVLVLKR